MTENSLLITEQHYRYLADRTTPEDDFLRSLKTEARAAGIPPIWVAPEQASLMQVLLKVREARDVVEVGTLAGYSAICMARALPPGGIVRTIEVSAKHADFAQRWIAQSDVAEKIRIFHGAGKDILPKFASQSADALFLDADKISYPFYLEEGLRILRPHGLIMADNAFAFGELFDESSTDANVQAMRAFNEIIARQDAIQSIIVPLGDGLWVGVKL